LQWETADVTIVNFTLQSSFALADLVVVETFMFRRDKTGKVIPLVKKTLPVCASGLCDTRTMIVSNGSVTASCSTDVLHANMLSLR
jgi:uncharacterized protein YcsI (UPF0317 family)